jgi:hypothetical protein
MGMDLMGRGEQDKLFFEAKSRGGVKLTVLEGGLK